MLTIKTDKQGNFQGQDEYWEVSKSNRRNINKQTPLLPQDPDFGWVAKLQLGRVGTFFTLILRQLSFKDSLRVWIVMLCVNGHPKEVLFLICCKIEETCIWHVRCTLTLVEHSGVAVIWFRHELTDVVMSCTQPEHVSELEQHVLCTEAWHKWHLTWIACAITERCSIRENVGSHWLKPSYKQIRGKKQKSFCVWSFRNRWTEMEQRVLARLRICMLVQKSGVTCFSQNKEFAVWKILKLGPSIEASQERANEELEEIQLERNTNEDLHCTPTMHTRYRTPLGQINWLQRRAQFRCCYKFSTCASQGPHLQQLVI